MNPLYTLCSRDVMLLVVGIFCHANCVLAASAPSVDVSLVDHQTSNSAIGYSGKKITLNFQNIEIRALLQVLADFTEMNIVCSDSVSGFVTLRLKEVPWDQALDLILQSRGLDKRRVGQVIWVAPRDEVAAREKQEFESQLALQNLEPLQTEVFPMNYAKALDIATHLRGDGVGNANEVKSSRLLSARGSVVAEPRTNQLFVTDVASKIAAVKELIKKLDIPVRQVMIEARIVEASDAFGRSLGVKLGGSDLSGLKGGSAGYPVGGGQRLAWGTYDAVATSTAEQSTPLTSGNTHFLSFPAMAQGSTAPATVALALFSPAVSRFLDLEISALQADGKGKVVASPRVITADQTQAEIEQGVDIPYPSVTASTGASTVNFRKASLRLTVTPQITPGAGIILNVEVNKDTPGTVYPGGVAVNTKRVKTNVLVENGGTVVIGGIFTSSEQEDVNKVPVLGDLPVAGHLFKSRSVKTEKTEMLVFLTPKVLSESMFPLGGR